MIVRVTDPAFWKMYDMLAQKQAWLSPIHGKVPLEYYRRLALDKRKKAEDRSYIVLREGTPLAAFIGATVEHEGTDLLAYEVPCISIEDREQLGSSAAKDFLREFDAIAKHVGGIIHYRDFLPTGEISILSRHLLSLGASSNTFFHRVIDLRSDEAALKRNIRKSYGSLINWGIRELTPQVVTHEDLRWEQMDAFRKLHIREAGRETRSENSWRRQYEWIKSGAAFIVLGHWQGELVSAGMFEYNRSNCVYGVSASRRDLFDKPLFHSLMWVALLHAKRLGCTWFEVGHQVFPKFPANCPPSAKEMGISEFKAGFGGRTRLMLDLRLGGEELRTAQ